MSPRRVAITGLGLVSPFGGDLADFFARLLAGEPDPTLAGVASDATRLRFTADGQYLIILDSRTRSVLQYRVVV